jgi:hypothetical protein
MFGYVNLVATPRDNFIPCGQREVVLGHCGHTEINRPILKVLGQDSRPRCATCTNGENRRRRLIRINDSSIARRRYTHRPTSPRNSDNCSIRLPHQDTIFERPNQSLNLLNVSVADSSPHAALALRAARRSDEAGRRCTSACCGSKIARHHTSRSVVGC